MKVYGFDDTGPFRGELQAALIDARDLDFGLDSVASSIEWVEAHTTLSAAKKSLIKAMVAVEADSELIQMVRSLKASYVPVTVEEI